MHGRCGQSYIDMVMADEVVSLFLPLSKYMAIFEMLAGENMVTLHVVALEDGEREAEDPTQAEVVESKVGGGMDGVLVSGPEARQVEISVVLAFAHQH